MLLSTAIVFTHAFNRWPAGLWNENQPPGSQGQCYLLASTNLTSATKPLLAVKQFLKMPEGEKQSLGHTAYELMHIYGGKIQEKPDYILYSHYSSVRKIPYKIQKEMKKVIRKNINILIVTGRFQNCKKEY